MFFREPANPGHDEQVQEAKRICASRIIRADCLAWAFAHYERFGLWGGLDENERRAVMQRRSKP